MRRWFVTSMCLVAAAIGIEAQETVHPNPRLAAVAYALQNGYEINRSNLVVASETTHHQARDPQPPGSARRPTLEVEAQEAQAIAKLLGAGVRVGSAEALVSCPEMRCYAATQASVLVVDALRPGDDGIYLKLYTPEKPNQRPTLQHVIVKVRQQGSGWIATGFSAPPKTIVVR